ncbi:glycoside hydrolase family 3 protein (plasmid) [Pseudorhodobacter turbinis]|uniref:beta-N-acetylhexosaminidase n=1 Tax=Pseudorhodobacter turbinis TaxID=2500533 RepID=A0A4P8EIL9_9RHOB|nr:glycoside hydrolase family 3 protein [Pseudorhodobacter turbinis]QCO56826.1 glycoside hydrolase family 3 protein [Pseudorhodobacter turbinis]
MTTRAAVLGCSGTTLLPEEAAFFRAVNPWGFILFARNVADPAQLRRLTAELRECVGRDAPVLVDQEGGRVQRLRAPHWSEWLAPLEMVKLAMATAKPGQGHQTACRAMELRYRLIASELHGVGIDVNCAPCLDVASAVTHPFLRNRCFSEDPSLVADLGRAAAKGHLAGGVLPIVKHMPGHGRASLDSHKALPHVSAPREVLEAHDFAPFRALNDLPIAMTAHIIYDAIDAENPATTSSTMVQLMRRDIGFEGLLVSDDLSMNALAGSLGERAAATIAAGVDIALHCSGDMAEMMQVVEAAGPMSTQAHARSEAALAQRCPPQTVDIAALRADLSGLVNG